MQLMSHPEKMSDAALICFHGEKSIGGVRYGDGDEEIYFIL